MSRTLADLASDLGTDVIGDEDFEVCGVRPLETAKAEHLSFLHNPKYVDEAKASEAGAILVADAEVLLGRNLLVCPEPYLALAQALEIFHPMERPEPGVHPSAVVAAGVSVGEGASIGPLASVAEGVTVGEGTVVGAGCVIGRGVGIGEDCLLHPRVVIGEQCRIGDRCNVHSGTVIGSDGFGFATVDGTHHKVPQVGIVVLEDDVELGANVCVDRAALGETRIGRGTKVDNLVQIAHNVQIGEHCLLVAQVGISGSTQIGHHTVFAGQSGCSGHLKIGSGVVLVARAAAYKDVPDGATMAGAPARPHREWLKANANLQRLGGLREKVKQLEKRLAQLEESTT
ncbi:MAG: UDP-3-O-(3-hydroxymyristoyl)glucosamine N-acyltransferase [Acidobacteria bacterium]|nr:UDP-3-O-(3-hydroxymyristoyl)glucosamine N-acyltransferase [Candidatus Sulfomarinibacter kjeldsenii]